MQRNYLCNGDILFSLIIEYKIADNLLNFPRAVLTFSLSNLFMIYESRSIRVIMIIEPSLHTEKETSVKPIFRSFKLDQAILSFIVAAFFFRFSNIKFQVIFSPVIFQLFQSGRGEAKRPFLKKSPFFQYFGSSIYKGAMLGPMLMFPFYSYFSQSCWPEMLSVSYHWAFEPKTMICYQVSG